MEACSKALPVFSSHKAHDFFTKTFNPAFIQESENNQRHLAHFAALAVKVHFDAVVKVKTAIDDMVTQGRSAHGREERRDQARELLR